MNTIQTLSDQILNCRKARAIIEQAPAERINLNEYARETECGTLFCALGWIARVPYFRALGLHISTTPEYAAQARGKTFIPRIEVEGKSIKNAGGILFQRLDELFGCNAWTVLFSCKKCSHYDYIDTNLDSPPIIFASQKALALNRFDQHIAYLEVRLADLHANQPT